MTIDWFVLLTPVVLLIVVMPFVFVGCTRFTSAPGTGTVAPPPAPPPAGTPPAPSTPPKTKFRLDMDPNLQLDLQDNPVTRIEVSWSVESPSGVPTAIVVPQPAALIKSTKVPPPDPPAIDPSTDPGVDAEIPNASVETRTRVRCICRVFLANGNTPNVAGINNAAPLQKDGANNFVIQSRRPGMGGFRVFHDGA